MNIEDRPTADHVLAIGARVAKFQIDGLSNRLSNLIILCFFLVHRFGVPRSVGVAYCNHVKTF